MSEKTPKPQSIPFDLMSSDVLFAAIFGILYRNMLSSEITLLFYQK
jgi:hypothetical protein